MHVRRIWKQVGLVCATACAGTSAQFLQADEVAAVDLADFPVYAGAGVAVPVAGAGQAAQRLQGDARVDLQTRGSARYQTDISIRGGIFEGSGLSIGGMVVMDPQTGHYTAELPLDAGFFGSLQLLTGVSNSINGFNATAGTIEMNWAPLRESGQLELHLGSDRQLGFLLRQGVRLGEAGGLQVSIGHESGDGSVAGGDFQLERISGRFEGRAGVGTLRLFGGYVQKEYGWPGMYTGRAALLEQETYGVGLVGLQWEKAGRADGEWAHRAGAYWRELDDDYEFNRLSPNNFFEHRTRVISAQGDGGFERDRWAVDYSWALVRDEVLSSTSLVVGDFRERDYAKAGVLVTRIQPLGEHELRWYGGATVDTSDQDSTRGLPQVGLRASGSDGSGGQWELYAEASTSSQVPGYTVLKSGPSGLFGGNAALGRELARTYEFGGRYAREEWATRVVVFRRQDRSLVDWVYDSSTPNARRAAAMDLDVDGVEALLVKRVADWDFELGYAYLYKRPDYLESAGDASFYALNYARQRGTLSIGRRFAQGALRLDGEYRKHVANLLRQSDASAFYLHFYAEWQPLKDREIKLVLRGLNLTDEDFEHLPGTPGAGREVQCGIHFNW